MHQPLDSNWELSRIPDSVDVWFSKQDHWTRTVGAQTKRTSGSQPASLYHPALFTLLAGVRRWGVWCAMWESARSPRLSHRHPSLSNLCEYCVSAAPTVCK